MELMVVVIIISILAALAIPSMVKSRDDRRAYNDASAVALLLRSARLRALGRGAAIAVHMQAAGASQRGLFSVYEAVTDSPTAVGTPTSGSQAYPFSSCVNTDWSKVASTSSGTFAAALVDGLNLNGAAEANINLLTVVSVNIAGTVTDNPADYWLCYTPTGRVFASGGTTPTFSGAVAFVDMDICIGRFASGVTPADCTSASTRPIGPWRHVLVPPTGMTRVFSK